LLYPFNYEDSPSTLALFFQEKNLNTLSSFEVFFVYSFHLVYFETEEE